MQRNIMYNFENEKDNPTERTGSENGINLDYDYNTEYGDDDLPDIDNPGNDVNNSEEAN
jgi:hypothetical protein